MNVKRDRHEEDEGKKGKASPVCKYKCFFILIVAASSVFMYEVNWYSSALKTTLKQFVVQER
jgi:hypothetical protein